MSELTPAELAGARFRCARGVLDEPIAGTAAHDTAYLLIEHPGPWGHKALAESRLPEHVRSGLADAAAEAGVRIQLIRRHGRAAGPQPSSFRVFLGNADPRVEGGPWLETTLLDVADDLLDLDLDGLAEGRRPGLEEHSGRLLLVCTNGRRDACCAEFGRPVAAALAAAFPEETWETSHLGGHRFAAAMLTLPEALSYGRLDPAAAVRIGELSVAGRLSAEHLRGRSAYPAAVQAAEIAVLTARGVDEVDGLSLVEVVPNADAGVETGATRVIFRHGSTTTTVDVFIEPGTPLRASCTDQAAKATTTCRAVLVAPQDPDGR
jgi:hypothetical protein